MPSSRTKGCWVSLLQPAGGDSSPHINVPHQKSKKAFFPPFLRNVTSEPSSHSFDAPEQQLGQSALLPVCEVFSHISSEVSVSLLLLSRVPQQASL